MCKQSDQSLEPAAEANTVLAQCGGLCSLRVLLKDNNV
jgi:hypothetical protein